MLVGLIMPKILIIKNSFCKLLNFNETELFEISKRLSYQNDLSFEKSRIIYQIKTAKRLNKLKQYYFLVGELKKITDQENVCWLLKDAVFPTGLLYLVKDYLRENNIPFEIKDQRVKPEKSLYIRKVKPFPKDRYFQAEMIDIGLREERGVFSSCVGSGKTHIMMRLVDEIGVPTLLVIPSRGLLKQVMDEFISYFGSTHIEHITSKLIEKNPKKIKPIRFVTVQTLASLNKKGIVDRALKDIDCLMLEEAHHSASESYTKLLPKFKDIYYRFSFSGTYTRNDSKILDLHAVLSNILYEYPAHQGIKDGYLTPIKAVIHHIQGKMSPNYQKEYANNYCGGSAMLYSIKGILESLKTNERALILVNRKDAGGYLLKEFLDNHGIKSIFISGDDSAETISKTIKDFNNCKIPVLIGSTVIGEGINVKSTDHLIMANGGKSQIAITQAVGRAVRLFKDKKMAFIHDFCFEGTKFMSKHLKAREKIYVESFGAEVEYLSN